MWENLSPGRLGRNARLFSQRKLIWKDCKGSSEKKGEERQKKEDQELREGTFLCVTINMW